MLNKTNLNEYPRCGEIWMCYLTSKMNKRKLPVHVELWSYQKYGLKTPSTLLVEQITTITIECLDKCIGKVSDKETLCNISNAIAIQFPVLVTV